MKIRLVSDTHIDFYSRCVSEYFVEPNTNSPSDEILILAGDIGEWKHSNKFIEFIQWASENFFHVIYVIGNHEYYGLDYYFTKLQIRDQLIRFSNVSFLDLEGDISLGSVDLFGFRFIGTTLWTDFNKNNPIAKIQSSDFMNDYRVIRNGEYKISPEFVRQINKTSIQNLKELVENSNLPVIVVTHHAPHELSHDKRYPFDDVSYSFFNTGLEDFILDHQSKIKLWCHGHIHCGKDYLIGETRIIANPAGYPNRAGLLNENREFSRQFSIDL
jgi:Icc-related predicted phosphoesterase